MIFILVKHGPKKLKPIFSAKNSYFYYKISVYLKFLLFLLQIIDGSLSDLICCNEIWQQISLWNVCYSIPFWCRNNIKMTIYFPLKQPITSPNIPCYTPKNRRASWTRRALEKKMIKSKMWGESNAWNNKDLKKWFFIIFYRYDIKMTIQFLRKIHLYA